MNETNFKQYTNIVNKHLFFLLVLLLVLFIYLIGNI